MRKYYLNYSLSILLLIVALSCNRKAENQNETEEDSPENVVTNIAQDSISKENFEVIDNYESEFTENDEGKIFLVLKFKIRNKSNVEINGFGYESKLTIKFNQDDFALYEYGTYKNLSGKISIDSLWKPNEVKTFKSIFPNTAENYHSFKKEYFQTTPKIAIVNFDFTARGIDGEFMESQSFDVVDIWKRYQKKIGYRK